MKLLNTILLVFCLLSLCFILLLTYNWHYNSPIKEMVSSPSIHPDITAERPPETLKITYLGTASILIQSAQSAIMVDAFFTRPTLFETVFTKIATDTALVTEKLGALKVHNLNAIFVQHSHHDHVMDAAFIAKKTGAVIVGTQSTANLARGADVTETQIKTIHSDQTFSFGEFEVTMIKGKHLRPNALFSAVFLDQEIETATAEPLYVTDYKEGGTYNIYIKHQSGNILVTASPWYLEPKIAKYPADIYFMGISQMGNFSNGFLEQYVTSTNPTMIVPVHWDNFMLPLSEPLRPFPWPISKLSQSIERLEEYCSQENISLQFLDYGEFVTLPLKKSTTVAFTQ